MKRIILIYDIIGHGGISAKGIFDQLGAANGKDIDVKINSSGGEVFEGMTIYNAIKSYKGKTRAYIEGIAYGIASIIALACDEIYMQKRAYFAISDPVIYQTDGVATKASPELDKIKNVLADIYIGKSKKTREEIFKMMERETWLTDKGAEVDGFVDFIYE